MNAPVRRAAAGAGPAARRAMSRIEFLGCLLAVAGGVWLGAWYWGINLEGAAFLALDETEMLEKVPEDWRPADPDCPTGDCPSPEQIRVEEQLVLRSELEKIRFEAARLTSGIGVVDEVPAGALTDEEERVRERTLAYWNSLAQIVFEVVVLQERVTPLAGTDYQARALSVRRRALEYGRDAVELLETDSVDREALSTGVRIAEWFDHGADMLKTALELRTRQPVGGRAMTAADVWTSTEAELAKRTDLVRRKSLETSGYLTSKYFVDFPPLGI